MYCPVCNKEIPAERVEYLRNQNYREHEIFCVKHAKECSVKGIYSGEAGSSELILCSRVYNDSVQKTFLNAEEDNDDEAAESVYDYEEPDSEQS